VPTTFVLEHDDRQGGRVRQPFQVVSGGPDPAVVEQRALLARDEAVRAPDPERAVPRGSMLQPAPGPEKAVGRAVAPVDRTDLPLSTPEFGGEAGAEARTTLGDRVPDAVP